MDDQSSANATLGTEIGIRTGRVFALYPRHVALVSAAGRVLPLVMVISVTWSTIAAQVLTPSGPVVERFLPDVPSGGGGVVGVQVDASGRSASVSSLTVYLPSHGRSSLCVSVNSQDGKYRGSVQFDISQMPSGSYQLDYRTKHRLELAGYQANAVAILAEIKNQCSPREEPEAVALANWTGAAFTDTLLVLVNSLSADRIELISVDAQPSCAESKSKSRVAFDWECVVQLPPGLYEMQLRRHYFDEHKSVKFHVGIP